jgi:uncharacterized protein (DUF433 family)
MFCWNHHLGLVMKPRTIGKHLVVDPRVCHGKLTFQGTRVPVETVLHVLSEGRSVNQVLRGWPELTREAIAEAVQLAADALVRQVGARVETADEPARTGRST